MLIVSSCIRTDFNDRIIHNQAEVKYGMAMIVESTDRSHSNPLFFIMKISTYSLHKFPSPRKASTWISVIWLWSRYLCHRNEEKKNNDDYPLNILYASSSVCSFLVFYSPFNYGVSWKIMGQLSKCISCI